MEKQKWKAGAGKIEIEIPRGYLAAENFKMVHDPLYVRAVAVQGERTLIIVSIEVTSLPGEEVDAIRNKIAEKLEISIECIWICVTHTFSAPHLLPDHMLKDAEEIALKGEYRKALQISALKAAETAYKNLEEVTIGSGSGRCNINVNRDVELPEGWWLGANETGLSDKTVSVIRMNNQEGKPVVLLYHYAIQSSVLDQSELETGGKAVSSDIVGQASGYVEQQYGDAVALFLLGAAGDQAPIRKAVTEIFKDGKRERDDLHEKGFEICENLGKQLGEEVCRIAKRISCEDTGITVDIRKAEFAVPGKEMNRDLKSLHPVREYTYAATEDQIMEVEIIRLGNWVFLGVKPELNSDTAAEIRSKSPFPNTLVVTMVNGASKYMASEASYDIFTYEAMNSPFGKGAAEIMTEEAVNLLMEMRG